MVGYLDRCVRLFRCQKRIHYESLTPVAAVQQIDILGFMMPKGTTTLRNPANPPILMMIWRHRTAEWACYPNMFLPDFITKQNKVDISDCTKLPFPKQLQLLQQYDVVPHPQ